MAPFLLMLFHFLVDLLDVAQDLRAPGAVFRRAGEMGREIFPLLQHGFLVVLQVAAELAPAELIGFGKHHGKGNLVFPQPFHEGQVYLLRLVPAVQQHEEADQVFPLAYVIFDELLKALLGAFAHLGVAIAGQVHQVPALVYGEVIDKLGFTGAATGFGQVFLVGQHIDQAAFAHVAPPYEGVFRLLRRGTLA